MSHLPPCTCPSAGQSAPCRAERPVYHPCLTEHLSLLPAGPSVIPICRTLDKMAGHAHARTLTAEIPGLSVPPCAHSPPTQNDVLLAEPGSLTHLPSLPAGRSAACRASTLMASQPVHSGVLGRLRALSSHAWHCVNIAPLQQPIVCSALTLGKAATSIELIAGRWMSTLWQVGPGKSW